MEILTVMYFHRVFEQKLTKLGKNTLFRVKKCLQNASKRVQKGVFRPPTQWFIYQEQAERCTSTPKI